MTKSRKRLKRSGVIKFLMINAALLMAVKLIIPLSQFQLATFVNQVLPFQAESIVEETNKARIANNVPPLSRHFALDIAAAEKFQDMVNKGYFAHVSPSGTTPWFWISKNQYGYIAAGENLALGFVKAEDAVGGWLESPSHRDNLLDPAYEHIGVAVGRADLEGIDGILIVQIFGDPARFTTTPPLQNNSSVLGANRQSISTSVGRSLDKTVSAPTKIIQDSVTDAKMADVANISYLGYLSLILGALAFMVIKYGLDKFTTVSIAGHVMLLILAVSIPAANVIKSGVIF